MFSSVDVHVCEAIFNKLITGLLLKRGKTIILALSQYRFLKHADNVILLNNGELTTDKETIEQYLVDAQHKEHRHRKISLHKSLEEADSDEEEEVDEEALKREEEEKQLAKEKQKEEEAEKNEEAREEGTVKKETILAYITAMGSIIFCFFIVMNYAMYGSRVVQDFWLKDQLQNKHFNLDVFVKTMIGLTSITVGVTLIRAYTWCFMSMRATKRIFEKLNHKILYAKMSFFDRNAIGRLISRLSGDVWVVDDNLAWIFHVFFENISRCTGFFVGIVF